MLRDAAVLARHNVGLADGIEQPGLTVVNVTHDGDNRRTCLEVLVAFGFQLGFEVDVEAGEQLALLVLRGHDLELVAKLLAEQREGLFIQRLRGRGHFAEVEEHRHQCGGVRLDLVGKVRDGRAAAEPDYGVAVAAGHAYATQRRSTHLLEFLTLGTLRLALLAAACAALTEGTLGAAATAAALTEATAGRSAATGTGSTGARSATRTAGTTAAATGTACTCGCGTFGAVRHHAGSRTVSAGSAGRAPGAPAGRGAPGRGHPAAPPDGERPDGDRQRLLRDGGRRGVRPRCGFRPDAACPGKERTGCCPDAGDVRCRRRGRGACPGTWRRGCCRDGDRPDGVPIRPGVPEQPGAGFSLRGRPCAGLGARRAGAAGSLGSGCCRSLGGGCCRGQPVRRVRPEPAGAAGAGASAWGFGGLRRSRAGAARAGCCRAGSALGAAAGASDFEAAGAAGKALRSFRTTGASMVEEAERTNSPSSCSLVTASLEVIPSSLASSCTRTLATFLLSRSAPSQARTVYFLLRASAAIAAERPIAERNKVVIVAHSSLGTHRVSISFLTRFQVGRLLLRPPECPRLSCLP